MDTSLNLNDKQDKVIYYNKTIMKKSSSKKHDKKTTKNLDLLKLIVNDAAESKLNTKNLNNIKKIILNEHDDTNNKPNKQQQLFEIKPQITTNQTNDKPLNNNIKKIILDEYNNDYKQEKLEIKSQTIIEQTETDNMQKLINNSEKISKQKLSTNNVENKNLYNLKQFTEAGFYSFNWPKDSSNELVSEIYVTIVNGGGGGGGALLVKSDKNYLMGGGGGGGSSGSAIINYCIRLLDLGYDYKNDEIILEIKVGEGGKGGKSKIINDYQSAIKKYVFEEAENGQSGRFSFLLLKCSNLVKKLGFFQKENLNFENGGGGAQFITGLNLKSNNENNKYDGNYIKGGKGGYFNWFFKNGHYEYEDYYLNFVNPSSNINKIKINNDYLNDNADVSSPEEIFYNFKCEPYQKMIKNLHTSLRFSKRVIVYQLEYLECNGSDVTDNYVHPYINQQLQNKNNDTNNNITLNSILNNIKSVKGYNNQLYSIEMMPRNVSSVKKQNIRPICYFDKKLKPIWNINEEYGLSVELSSLCGQGGGCAIGKFVISDSNCNNLSFTTENLYKNDIYTLLNKYVQEQEKKNNVNVVEKLVIDYDHNLNLTNKNIENIVEINKKNIEFLDSNTLEYDIKKRWEHGELFDYTKKEQIELQENNNKWVSGGSTEFLLTLFDYNDKSNMFCGSGGKGASIYYNNDNLENGHEGNCGMVQIKWKI